TESLELARSIPIYLTMLRDHPTDPEVLFDYGRALEYVDRLDSALQLYRDAASLNDKDVRPQLRMVAAYIDRPNPDIAGAKPSLDYAQKIAPANPDVLYWSGRQLFLEKKPEQAKRNLEAAVAAEPKNANYHFWLGKITHEGMDRL